MRRRRRLITTRTSSRRPRKGLEANGPSFLNVIAPCPRGWRFESAKTIEIAKLAVETCMWPLYEYEQGEWRLTADSKRIAEGTKKKRPISEWLKSQGRFSHLSNEKWAYVAEEIQVNVDTQWKELLRLCKT